MLTAALRNDLLQSLCLATVTLLKKKDKDTLSCGSFRPVSLLKVDSKIIAKALAFHIETVIQTLICSNRFYMEQDVFRQSDFFQYIPRMLQKC